MRTFCRECWIVEAHEALESLEASLAAELKSEDDAEMKTILQQLESKLKVDPMLVKLRLVQVRMNAAVKLLRTPKTKNDVEVSLWFMYRIIPGR